ncbi:MAG: HEPN domain-containing protein [Chloroflexaceae bacterium]|nr:HEPN domain-containing protein [Chloroflexaceae bacterium]
MNEQTQQQLQPFLAEIQQQSQQHYGDRLAALVLFGSQARGDAVSGSDIDVLVVVHGSEQPQDSVFAGDLTAYLLEQYDQYASLFHISFDTYLHEQSPRLINIRREGMLLTDGASLEQLPTPIHVSAARVNGMTPEQEALLHRARENLNVTRLLYAQGFFTIAASRAYSSMFSVAQALLLMKGLAYSKHAAVIAAFGQHIAHPGIVPTVFHRYLIDAQQARIIGDYALEASLTEPAVATLISQAEALLTTAEHVLMQSNGASGG